MIEALRTMASGAVRDRLAAIGAVAAAFVLLATAWMLGVAALVLLLAGPMGMVGALATVTAGLVALALALVGLTRRQNRRTARERASTRALWTATAVNAAGTLLRRAPSGRSEVPDDGLADRGTGTDGGATGGGGHRSALLIGGGIALILLGLFLPSGPEEETEPEAGQGPEDVA